MEYPGIIDFVKKNRHLVCIDSDGTAIDAMNVKHNKCHGPSFIEFWDLHEHRDEIQRIWNDINLYQPTRGVNRFIALVKILETLDGVYLTEEGLPELKRWMESTHDLSNGSLEKELQTNHSNMLDKAYRWSLEINRRIAALTPSDKPPYDGAKEFLEYAYERADLAIISSSNMDAIVEEWRHHDMLKYIGAVTSQEIGTKGECIGKMIMKGYSPDDVLMIGDAQPDVDAARENGVHFYPIVTGSEGESWQQLKKRYFDDFISGRYDETEIL